jgi:CubicO group peptidase (beta-lactamase class C family)
MNAQHIPGIVLVVLKDGKVLKQQAYGLANAELGVPTSLDSVFPLASVTKVFTGQRAGWNHGGAGSWPPSSLGKKLF